eukprot:GCRY01003719.1.p1 GENE.GCRY01003719.1~~GCRY01003719.1.p1  ORF type:complete len:614 (+),score=198.26 GCRY01003719.1:189-2030(+)
MVSTEEELQASFQSVAGLLLPEDLVDTCLEICSVYQLSPDDLATKWDVYAANKNVKKINLQELNTLKSSLSTKRSAAAPLAHSAVKRRSATANVGSFNKSSLTDLLGNSDILSSLGASPSSPASSTPVSKKQKTDALLSPSILPSPGGYTPAPKGKSKSLFKMHENSGAALLTVNDSLSERPALPENARSQMRVDEIGFWAPALLPADTEEPFRHMFSNTLDRVEALDSRIAALSKPLQKKHKIESFANVGVSSQSEMTVVGRVLCDAEGKLNPTSVVLEGETGQTLRLNLDKVPQFALFPGQVVAVTGTSPNGITMLVDRIYEAPPRPLALTKLAALLNYHHSPTHMNNTPLSIFAAAGPFTTIDDYEFAPLKALMDIVTTTVPDLVILSGPFVPYRSNLSAAADVTFASIFKTTVLPIIETAVTGSATRVLIAPSSGDLAAEPCYPQPPLATDTKHITFLPNPCVCDVNEITVGVNATDIIKHLIGAEIARNAIPTERLLRQAHHILSQRNFYPLFPPAEDVLLDHSKSQYFELPVSPDILILPSSLKYFAKEIDGVLAINPGALVKGRSSGTYAKLTVHPLPKEVLSAQPGGAKSHHQIASRTRVDIARL